MNRIPHFGWVSAAATGIALGLTPGAIAPVQALPATPQASPGSSQNDEGTWRALMSRTPLPHKGCFVASYPVVEWSELACAHAPLQPYAPSRGKKPAGGGDDWVAATESLIYESDGTFSTTGLNSEQQCHKGICDSNVYSIQLNSGYFASSSCKRGCWQQFVYSSGRGKAFMQYWQLNHRNTRPWGWHRGRYDVGTGCWKNSKAVDVPSFPITDLNETGMQASASDGTLTIRFLTNGNYYAVSDDDLLNLGANWHVAEYNIVGDGGGREAKFNRGTTITVTVTMDGGEDVQCEDPGGYGAETNNLTLGDSCYMDGTYISYDEFR